MTASFSRDPRLGVEGDSSGPGLGLKTIRARQPPDAYLAQVLEILIEEGLALGFPAAAQRVRDLPKRIGFSSPSRVIAYWGTPTCGSPGTSCETKTRRWQRCSCANRPAATVSEDASSGQRKPARLNRVAHLLLRSQVGQRDVHAFCIALGHPEEGTILAFARDLGTAQRSEAPCQRL